MDPMEGGARMKLSVVLEQTRKDRADAREGKVPSKTGSKQRFHSDLNLKGRNT